MKSSLSVRIKQPKKQRGKKGLARFHFEWYSIRIEVIHVMLFHCVNTKHTEDEDVK